MFCYLIYLLHCHHGVYNESLNRNGVGVGGVLGILFSNHDEEVVTFEHRTYYVYTWVDYEFRIRPTP